MICPENTKLGEFTGNHAHSNGRYGLRLFHNLIPRKFPCKGISYDFNKPEDPYHKNPLITANFVDFTGWKNGRNGAIAERVGDVRFINFKTTDNKLAGIEFSIVDGSVKDNKAQIKDAIVVGKSNAAAGESVGSPHGIITPRTENFSIKGVKFYNYNFGSAAALGTCSHCFHMASTDSGARTIKIRGAQFDETVTKKIRWQFPETTIF